MGRKIKIIFLKFVCNLFDVPDSSLTKGLQFIFSH